MFRLRIRVPTRMRTVTLIRKIGSSGYKLARRRALRTRGSTTYFIKQYIYTSSQYAIDATGGHAWASALQLRSLVAAGSKLHIHQHFTHLMRCRADGRVE